MSVTLELPFGYYASVVRPRSRVSEAKHILERLPVHVPEIEACDAPVIATVATPRGARAAEPDPFVYRLVNGRVARSYSAGMQPLQDMTPFPSRAVHRTVQGIAATIADLGAWWDTAVAAAVVPTFKTSLLPTARVLDNAIPLQCLAIKAVTDSKRDDQAARLLSAFLNGAAFVDGVLYVPSSGPAVAFDSGRGFWAEPEWSLGCTARHGGQRLDHPRFFAHDIPWLDGKCRTGEFEGSIRRGEPSLERVDCEAIQVADYELLREAVRLTWDPAARDMAILDTCRRIDIEGRDYLRDAMPRDIGDFGRLIQDMHAGRPVESELRDQMVKVARVLAKQGHEELLQLAVFLANPHNDIADLPLSATGAATPGIRR